MGGACGKECVNKPVDSEGNEGSSTIYIIAAPVPSVNGSSPDARNGILTRAAFAHAARVLAHALAHLVGPSGELTDRPTTKFSY